MASIRKTSSGKWEAQIARKGVRKSRTFDTKAQLEAWVAIEEARIKEHIDLKRKFYVHPKATKLLDLDGILKISSPFPNTSGIYFLIDNGVIVYIGKSKNVASRLSGHDSNGRKFTHYAFVPCSLEDLDSKEVEYISAYRPSGNKNLIEKLRADYVIRDKELEPEPM